MYCTSWLVAFCRKQISWCDNGRNLLAHIIALASTYSLIAQVNVKLEQEKRRGHIIFKHDLLLVVLARGLQAHKYFTRNLQEEKSKTPQEPNSQTKKGLEESDRWKNWMPWGYITIVVLEGQLVGKKSLTTKAVIIGANEILCTYNM